MCSRSFLVCARAFETLRLSKEDVEGDSITSICGTPEYLAPEILRKQAYGASVDWWSLGTVLFEMISGLPPFFDKNRQVRICVRWMCCPGHVSRWLRAQVMYKKILESELRPPAFMSLNAVDLCSKLLVRDPTMRLGYSGADELKSHPFFKGIDWAALERMEVSVCLLCLALLGAACAWLRGPSCA
jgi:serum/glucocorticoid-regulated kinase 2